jgi:hypothetical protein
MQPPNPTAIVGPPVIRHGVVNVLHTSAVALVYLTHTLPTPWLFYLASIGVSLLMMILATFTTRRVTRREAARHPAPDAVVHGHEYRSSETVAMRAAPKTLNAISQHARRCLHHAMRHLLLLINCARTAGTLGLTVRVLQQHGDARQPALSTISSLLVSQLPYAARSQSFWAVVLTAADVLVLIICAFVTTFAGARSNGSIGYGDLAAVGGAGTCLLNIPADELHSGHVGCGLDAVGKYRNSFDGGSVGSAELILHSCLGGPYAFVTLAAVVIALVGLVLSPLCCVCRYPFRRRHNHDIHNNHNNRDNSSSNYGGNDDITLTDFSNRYSATARQSSNRGQNARDDLTSMLAEMKDEILSGAIFCIFLYIVVLFPIYYVQ